jgi:hypothetical protein
MNTAASRLLSHTRRLPRAIGSHLGKILWVITGLFILAFIHHSMNAAYVELEVQTDHTTGLAIYWADEHENYSEARVNHIRIFPHNRHYTLQIGDLKRINRLRIDPATQKTTIRISEFSIHQRGMRPIRMRGSSSLQQIQPLRHIETFRILPRELFMETGGHDPQLEFRFEQSPQFESVTFGILWRSLLLIALCVLFIRRIGTLATDYAFVPYAMLAAFTLIFVMATLSRINAHPDEYVHLLAARYYVDHTLPPAACDKEILGTFSPYGVSRLHSTEIAYFLTGKFARLISFLPVTEAFELRYYNVALFGILLLLSIRSIPFRMVCLPLLASPQVWYIFSYVNSEGTALFAALLAAHQLIDEDSWFRRLARGVPLRMYWVKILSLGGLLAVLLLSKKNFFVFDLFVVLLAASVLLVGRHRTTGAQVRQWLSGTLPIVLVAATICGIWIYQHQAANDFNRGESIAECRENMATKSYRRDATLEDSHPTLYWRDKGYPFTALFENRWGTKVFYSGFGHFGYLEVLAGIEYYQATALLLILFFAYILYAAARRGTWLQRWIVLLGAGTFTLMLGLTMWMAWTRDFQPQGRYFFPMIPIVAIVIAWLRGAVNPRILTGFFILFFCLSLYFFLFVGLPGIRKH